MTASCHSAVYLKQGRSGLLVGTGKGAEECASIPHTLHAGEEHHTLFQPAMEKVRRGERAVLLGPAGGPKDCKQACATRPSWVLA